MPCWRATGRPARRLPKPQPSSSPTLRTIVGSARVGGVALSTAGAQVGRVVAIRDGKTAAETVRVEAGGNGQTVETPAGQPPGQVRAAEFEELLMLDSAGRVQIPREVLETLGIGGRVRLEVQGEGIFLQAVDGHRREKRADGNGVEQELFFEEEPLPETQPARWRDRVRKLLKRRAG